MDFSDITDIATSGLRAQRTRMTVTASNRWRIVTSVAPAAQHEYRSAPRRVATQASALAENRSPATANRCSHS